MIVLSRYRILAALLPVALLTACGSGRDADLAEKVARAEAAARRAEQSAQAAENAARRVGAQTAAAQSGGEEVIEVDQTGQDSAQDTAPANDEPAQSSAE